MASNKITNKLLNKIKKLMHFVWLQLIWLSQILEF